MTRICRVFLLYIRKKSFNYRNNNKGRAECPEDPDDVDAENAEDAGDQDGREHSRDPEGKGKEDRKKEEHPHNRAMQRNSHSVPPDKVLPRNATSQSNSLSDRQSQKTELLQQEKVQSAISFQNDLRKSKHVKEAKMKLKRKHQDASTNNSR